LLATAGGVVAYARRFSNFGKFIVIDHGSGYETAYGHLNAIKVRQGQRISKGQVIGAVGSTGRSTAPHLHYEVRVNGRAVNPLDFVFEDSRHDPVYAHAGSPRHN